MRFLLFLITPLLGSFRNFVKHKKFDIILFIRSPIITFVIVLLLYFFKFQGCMLLFSIVIERWLMLFLKGILSIQKKDNIYKSLKYKHKYFSN